MKRLYTIAFCFVSHVVYASILQNAIIDNISSNENISLLDRARSSSYLSIPSRYNSPAPSVDTQTTETSQSTRMLSHCEKFMNTIYTCDSNMNICYKKNCEEISSHCARRDSCCNLLDTYCCIRNESRELSENCQLFGEAVKTYEAKEDNKASCFCTPNCKACCCFPIGRPDLHDNPRVQLRRMAIDMCTTCICLTYCAILAC